MRAALRDLLGWKGIGASLSLSVNLSAINLLSDTLVDNISRNMNLWDSRPRDLILEVTESAMMVDPEKSLAMLSRLCELGFRCSIDDFGTGYSSFSYLKKLPVSELKIDKSFIQNMRTDPADENIVRSVVSLAHNFNLQITAEGVEDRETMDFLHSLGCDYGQGYYFGKPMNNDDFRTWMRESGWIISRD